MSFDSTSMINRLDDALLNYLPDLVQDISAWDSLLINRRKPHTYRVFTHFGCKEQKLRICLHKFDTCFDNEAFDHPHPWPAAFIIMSGGYRMRIGYSKDRFSKPEEVSVFEMRQYSKYEIVNPLTWHSVTPVTTTYTIMINDEPWDKDIAHTEVRTTKGKDLEKMPDNELIEHLNAFKVMLNDYNER
jgi:hypothetical protein